MKKLIKLENALIVAKVTNLLVVSVKLMTIVKNTDGSVPNTNGTLMKPKAANKSVNVVRKVTTLTVTTNVLNCHKTVKRLISKENALIVARATNSLMVSVKLMTIVKNTDGSVLIKNGHILGLKAANKFVNVVRRVITLTGITNVNHYHAIVKKLILMEAANVVKKVMNFVKENVFQLKNIDIEFEEPLASFNHYERNPK